MTDTENNISASAATAGCSPRMFGPDPSNPRVPASPFPFRHRVGLQIRFSDIDMLGHVNNNSYMSMMDLGKFRYYSDVFGESFSFGDIRAVVANISCDFYAPTYIDEHLEVWTVTTRLGGRSFEVEQRIVSQDAGQVKCIGRTVLVGFDPQSGRSAPLDSRWVEALMRFEQRDLRADAHGSSDRPESIH